MEPPRTEKEQMREWLENWKVVSEETERLKAIALRALTEEQSATLFNEMDCDPSLIWISPEKIYSSGLVEQQRIFAKAHRYAPGLRSSP